MENGLDSIYGNYPIGSSYNVKSTCDGTDDKGKQNLTLQRFSKSDESKIVAKNGHTYDGSRVFCSYCKLVFVTEEELKAHCSTEAHQLAITTDDDKKWQFRPPPRGLHGKPLSMCDEMSKRGICRLGDQCLGAHSKEEIIEWKERLAYREQKMEQARQDHLNGSSYAEQLLERWMKSQQPHLVMTDAVDTIRVEVSPTLFVTFSTKNSGHVWTFMITSKLCLRLVALLYDGHRKHFTVRQVHCGRDDREEKTYEMENICQEWHNPNFGICTDNTIFSYTVQVQFKTDIFGTFRQTVAFDFGDDPILTQKVCADVVPPADLALLQEVRETVLCATERWNSCNTVCVLMDNKTHVYTDNDLRLLYYYPIPQPGNFVVTQAVASPMPLDSNYKARFHELLYMEEIAQYNLMARYNVSSKLNLITCYILTPGTASIVKYSQKGELFACMKLNAEVSEDSQAGRMIQSNCSSVFIAPHQSSKRDSALKRKVYEAAIEDKGKKMIYLRLSERCVSELNLCAEKEYIFEVQFQLNRMPFCEMHYAVDSLSPVSLLFPNIKQTISIPQNTLNMKDLDENLNPKQREAIQAIVAPLELPMPPILIIGPFGTGKTFTLAQAVKQLLCQPNTRILVCTHSNSAADIYIREYLHPLVSEGRMDAVPLRIYYRHRWVATVNQVVLQYCLVSDKESTVSFRMPTQEDLEKHRIVVTTLSSSRYLVNLQLKKGFFTHILIDEAAQAMETEVIMPLALADENTRIALAGDHMQLSPEVYSQFAQEKNLQLSLLERLFDLYSSNFPCKILLCENYRSHKSIVQYTSDMFYENSLLASKEQPKHKTFYPLTFFTARGDDVQDTNSTAYYNNSEVYEVAERIVELQKSWPKEWGPITENSIGVVSPYYDQVVRIRTELRKRKLHKVSVERVLNVQGKQFRAIVLSTVRTLQTCTQSKGQSDDLDYGFLSNARLLNTAITRGQSLVAVVGDPVSLCSMGRCRKLWEKFIRICYENDSLFGISWQSLQAQLDGLELKKTYMLNPLAPEFIPRKFRLGKPLVSVSGDLVIGSSPYYVPPIATPCYQLPPMNTENTQHNPMYPFGPFPETASLQYPYIGLPFQPPFFPLPYGPYSYPWLLPPKTGGGAGVNAQQQGCKERGPNFRMDKPRNGEVMVKDGLENGRLNPSQMGNLVQGFMQAPSEEMIFDYSLTRAQHARASMDRFKHERNKMENHLINGTVRLDQNRNFKDEFLDFPRMSTGNSSMDQFQQRRGSEEAMTNGLPYAVRRPFRLEPEENHMPLPFVPPHYSMDRSLNQFDPMGPKDLYGGKYLGNMDLHYGFVGRGGNPSDLLFGEQRLARYPLPENDSLHIQRRNSLPNSQPMTLEQLELILLSGNEGMMQKNHLMYDGMRDGRFQDERTNMGLTESTTKHNQSLNNICDRLTHIAVNKHPNHHMIPDSQFRLNSAMEYDSHPAQEKDDLQGHDLLALEKLLQVSQKVWSQPPLQNQASRLPSASSVLSKACSESELFDRYHRLNPAVNTTLEVHHENRTFPQYSQHISGPSLPERSYCDAAMTNGMDKPDSGYSVFQHKTILNDIMASNPNSYGNIL